jgi:hypothetical protein
MTPSSSRPRVICHMAASVDGRVVVDGWPLAVASAAREDFRAPGDFDSFAFAIAPSGRLAWGPTTSTGTTSSRSSRSVSLTNTSLSCGRATSRTSSPAGAAPRGLALEHVERRPDGVLWLRYRVEPRSERQ